jgi:zinc/manganese transport system substrate-binding protein
LFGCVEGTPSPGKLTLTTTEDFASIAREVGGDRVTVEAIARGYQDPHFVEVAELHPEAAESRLLIVVGRELEIGWLPPLVQQAATKIQPGAAGYLDASLGAQILEMPTGQITRPWATYRKAMWHYWMVRNGKRIG